MKQMHSDAPPLITTIIPTYRRPQQLRRAIRSVLNQTLSNFKVCIYDNASGDETQEIVAELSKADNRINYYRHEKNIGPFRNFQYGMKQVDTPYFSFLSDDDVLLPWFYEIVMEGFNKFPDAYYSAGSSINMDEQGKAVPGGRLYWESEGYFVPPEGFYQVMKNGLLWTSVLFRKEVISEVGLVDPEVGAPIDQDLLCRIAARYPYYYSKKPCSIFVRHSSSQSMRSGLDAVWPGPLKRISNLTQDERIPLDIRIEGDKFLTQQIKSVLFWSSIKHIKYGKFDVAYKIAEILSNRYSEYRKAAFIKAFANINRSINRYMPKAYMILRRSYINVHYRVPKWSKQRELQKNYGEYAKYLKEEDSIGKTEISRFKV